jgi:hypothetical protein
MATFRDSPAHQTLELWRSAARDLAELPRGSRAADELRRTVDALRRQYVEAFRGVTASPAEPSPVADELAHISDDFMATVSELETLIRHRDTVGEEDGVAFDRAIERASAELLRLSVLERQVSSAAESQGGTTIEDAEAATPDLPRRPS